MGLLWFAQFRFARLANTRSAPRYSFSPLPE